MVAFAGIYGVTASVELINDHGSHQQLQEYQDDELTIVGNANKNVARYIQSSAGAQFVVRLSVDRQADIFAEAYCYEMYVDGAYCDGVIFSEKDIRKGGCTYLSKGRHISKSTRAPYRFTRLEKDDRATQTQGHRIEALGCIEVVLRYTVITGRASSQRWDYAAPVGSVSEKLLKGQAKSHTVSFGPAEAASIRSPVNCYYVGTPHSIKFHYRSEDDLRAMLILPPLLPLPTLIEQDPTNMSTADIRAMQDELRKLKAIKSEDAAAPTIKRERTDDHGQDQAQKRAKITVTLVIDDDDEDFREEPTQIPVLDLTA